MKKVVEKVQRENEQLKKASGLLTSEKMATLEEENGKLKVILYECFTILIPINFKGIIKYAHSPLNILTGWSFIFQSQQDLLAGNLKVATEWVCFISTVSEPLFLSVIE